MSIVNATYIHFTETVMNKHFFMRHSTSFDVIENVSCKLSCVKRALNKISLYSMGVFAITALLLGSAPARAQDVSARAIMNSTHLLNFVDGVLPEFMPQILQSIGAGGITRREPSMPVWIISSDTGQIMYYQGQKEFVGEAASRLVDDAGFRFGLRAVEYARNSRSAWVRLQLGGVGYNAYCATKAPFVVCSLIQ